jgi:flagellar biosynthesis protein FlhG
LGLRSVQQGIGTFLNNPDVRFDDIIVTTEYDNLRFVPGDAEIPGMANLKSSQKGKIIRRLLAMDADYLVMDLGAGTSYNIMDFFLTSGRGIVVTTPTLTATLNAYLFLKNAVFRLMTTAFKRDSAAFQYIEKLRKEGSPLQRLYIPKLLDAIRKEDPDSHTSYVEGVSRFHPRLIMNMLEDPKDADKAGKLRRSSREYLGVDIEHLGIIYRDDIQGIALSARLPIILYKPYSVLSQAIYRIADKLVQEETDGEGPLNLESLDDTYQIAEMEAEIDFESKLGYLEELLHSGALTMGDLIETIKSQQFEINQLKKENQLIKAKLVKAMQAGFRA